MNSIETRRGLRRMDLDTSPAYVDRQSYIYGLNVTHDAVTAANGDRNTVNITGNRLVSFTLPSGRNKVIGFLPVNARNKAYYFVWNENDRHSVLEYDGANRTVTKVLQNMTDTGSVDILAFTEAGKINSIDILLRNEGDLLFFLDSTYRPTALNITKLKAGTYTPVTRAIIDVAKDVPLYPPTAVYGNDTARRVNNLRNTLCRFKTRWVYDDDYKTTCSPVSKVPRPASILDETYTNIITNNNKITVTFTTGDKSVKAIELLVSYSHKANEWSDFELVKSFDKAAESISNDTTTSYAFYKDGTYPVVDVAESDLLFDYLPLYARAQAMPNGNVLAYAAITEGYSRSLTANVTTTVSTAAVGAVGTVGTLVATYVDLGIGNTFYHARAQFAGTPATGTVVTVRARWRSDGLLRVIGAYTTGLGDTTATITAYLAAHVTGFFIGIDASTATTVDYSLRREYWEPHNANPGDPNTSGVFITIEVVPPTASGPTVSDSVPRWKWSSERRIGIAYYDRKGRTNGILYDTKVTFPAYAESASVPLAPTLNIKIYHRAPDWAYSYGFAVNHSRDGYLWWQTPRVFNDNDFFYFDISNFEINATKTPATATVLSYTYAEGDRLRLLKRISDGTVYADTFDANVEGVLEEVYISSTKYTGKFLKIKNISPFTGTDVSSGNFVIEIYRPTPNVAEKKNDVFFEIGEQYAILNPGTSTRTHVGGVGNQSTDLVTPAETQLDSGDAYFRVRSVYLSDNGFGRFFCMDRNFVDSYNSAVSSCDGRSLVIDVNAKQDYYPTLIRHGQAYQQNTSVNGLNRFYAADFDEYGYAFSDVQRLAVRGKYLYVFQKGKIGEVPLFNQITKDPQGNSIGVVTDRLLNPIQYYMGEFGIGDAPESLAQFNYAFYGCDTNKGVIWRLSQDGITPISIVYKVNSWGVTELPQRTGNYKIYGAFNQKSSSYLCALEATGSSAAQTIVFSEEGNTEDNGFETFVSFHPEMMGTLGNLLIAFKDGALWTHDSDSYNTFFGTTYDSVVTIPFNEAPVTGKTWIGVRQVGSAVWDCPLIYSNVNSYGSQRQETNLLAGEFAQQEGWFVASLKRDVWSRGGKVNGSVMKGQVVVVQFRRQNATTLSYLSEAAVSYIESPPNR